MPAKSLPVTGPTLLDSMTCEPSEPTTSPPAMSSVVDSLAQISVLQADALASTVLNLVFGGSSRASFARFDHASSSWKTCQESFPLSVPTGSKSTSPRSFTFSATLPRAGMMRSGSLSALPTLARGMSGIGLSLSRGSLAPTLTVHGNDNRKGLSATSGDGIATAIKRAAGILPESPTMVARLSPALTATDATSGPGHAASSTGSPNLRTVLSPTLTARDHRSGKASQATHDRPTARPLNEMVTGPIETSAPSSGILNPDWCDVYQGAPIGWSRVDSPSTSGASPPAPTPRSTNGSRPVSRRGSKGTAPKTGSKAMGTP